MKTITLKIALFALLAVGLASCNNTKKGVVAYQNMETVCLGSELDGSYTVRAWGTGRYLGDAKEQTKKNAVYDCLFKGILRGQGDCEARPIMTEVNAREKYQAYFDSFFADGGDYLKYISMKDRRPGSWTHARMKGGITCSMVIRVDYAKLRSQLREDGILK